MANAATKTPSAVRSFFSATSRWIDTYAKSSMSSSEALAMRDAILAQQWEKSSARSASKSQRTR